MDYKTVFINLCLELPQNLSWIKGLGKNPFTHSIPFTHSLTAVPFVRGHRSVFPRTPRNTGVCHSHEWRVDTASGLTLKKQNACLHAVRHAVGKKIACIHGLRSEGVNKLFCGGNDNKKLLFAFVRSKRKSPCPPVINNHGEVIHKPDMISQMFSEYFNSVFVLSETELFSTPPECDFSLPPVRNAKISSHDIAQIIDNLPNDKSPGPDNITPRLLKSCSGIISPILCKLFCMSLSQGELPSMRKRANITPVFKSGDTSVISNYRPIALTSVVCKIMETVIASMHHQIPS